MIPSLEWHVFYRAFEAFAAMARKYHFYDSEVNRMETSIFAMAPFSIRKEDAK